MKVTALQMVAATFACNRVPLSTHDLLTVVPRDRRSIWNSCEELVSRGALWRLPRAPPVRGAWSGYAYLPVDAGCLEVVMLEGK